MHDRGDHYLGNSSWASSGDGVAADNWELAGGRPRPDDGSSSDRSGRPRPASPGLSLVTKKPAPPTTRPLGSVTANKPVSKPKSRPVPETSIGSTVSATTPASSRSAKHRVFQSLQRDKLLMGGERELSQINITITMLLGLLTIMGMNWHLAVVAVLFGGPVQWAIRILSERDPDYVKTYLEGLTSPHIREPE